MKRRIILSSDADEVHNIENYDQCLSSNDVDDASFFQQLSSLIQMDTHLIIGKTEYYTDHFIDRVVEVGEAGGAIISNYHIYTHKPKSLIPTSIPIIYVAGILPNMSEMIIAKKLSAELTLHNKKVLIISSDPMDSLNNYELFPWDLISKLDSVYQVNQWINSKIFEYHPDYIIIGVPGGIIQSEKYNPLCDYGLIHYVMKNAMPPSYIVCSVLADTVNLAQIPNPFYPHKIDYFVKGNKILDQNNYDFFMKNRLITVDQLNDRIIKNESYSNFDNLNSYSEMVAEIIR